MKDLELVRDFVNVVHRANDAYKGAKEFAREEKCKLDDLLLMLELEDLTPNEKARLLEKVKIVQCRLREFTDDIEELAILRELYFNASRYIDLAYKRLCELEETQRNRAFEPKTDVCDGIRNTELKHKVIQTDIAQKSISEDEAGV